MSREFLGDSLVEMLRYRATVQPHDRAYTFLRDGDEESFTVTWSELDRHSRAIAAHLQTRVAPGERALLLYPPGLDFIAAFFGCLYARVVAVPVQMPHGGRADAAQERLRAIADDATPAAVLTTAAARHRLQAVAPLAIEWVVTDQMHERVEQDWRAPDVSDGTLAFLQYTSGSTARPRGVMVTHGNLIHNLASAFHLGETPVGGASVSWLPVTHDMGLIEGVLQPAFSGCPAYLMSPGAFLQRPVRWLKAISRYGAVRSGAPNFAFDLVVERVPVEQREDLALESWSAAYNGAEPIRDDTLRRFSEAFSACGFDGSAFRPSYGLAESTLLVTTRRWQAAAASDGVVSCGHPAADTRGRDRGRGHRPAVRGRRDRRDQSHWPQRRAGVLAAPGGDRAHVRWAPRRLRCAVAADRRSRHVSQRRAVRHRPHQGPAHRARSQALSAGHRAQRRAVPSTTCARARSWPWPSRPAHGATMWP